METTLQNQVPLQVSLTTDLPFHEPHFMFTAEHEIANITSTVHLSTGNKCAAIGKGPSSLTQPVPANIKGDFVLNNPVYF